MEKIYTFTSDELRAMGNRPTPPDTPLYIQELYAFLHEWFDDSSHMTIQTSGSTGIPKQITVQKEKMIQSARLTCSFLALNAGDIALLCMPLQYIAGKMMVVRALTAGLTLRVTLPSGRPLTALNAPVDFIAMVPMQLVQTLQHPEEKVRLQHITNVIIGGGSVDADTENELRSFPNRIYATYGMTETLSHVAMRRLSGTEASAYYTPFPSVTLSLSPQGTLMIHAPLVCDDVLTTNDVAELLPDGRFTIQGRIDNVINSGGIKVQAEEVEKKLHAILPNAFVITSVPHPLWGEAIVLLIEQPADTNAKKLTGCKPMDIQQLKEAIARVLPKHQQPKYMGNIERIPLTGYNKIDRSKCKSIAKALFKQQE